MTTKICKDCERPKHISQFYKGQGECKECFKAKVRAHRLLNIEKVREYDRRRANLPHRVERRKSDIAAYNTTFPDRRIANNAVSNAIRDGRLFKWPVCAIPECDCTKVVAHHADYSRPLDVVWLCQAHHKQAHGKTL